MATYNKHYRWNPTRRKKQRYALLERVINFGEAPVSSGDRVTTAWAAGDVLQAVGIRAGQTVLHVVPEVVSRNSSATGAERVSIGDGDNASRWGTINMGIGADTAVEGVTPTADLNAVEMYTAPKYYASADTVDVTLGAAITGGKLKLIVHILEDDR